MAVTSKAFVLLLMLWHFAVAVPNTAHYPPRAVRRGGRRNQSHSKIYPKHDSWVAVHSKILSQLSSFQNDKVKVDERNLVIYHIGDIGLASNSIDIASNNLKIFLSSVGMHDPRSRQKAFYLFNVIGGFENPLASYIPVSNPNVGVLEWNSASSDMDTHLRTMRLLSYEVTGNYSAIMFINQGVRGPLTHRKNGEWLGEFKRLMDRGSNVAMVGPTLSCEVSPHVQTHVFALKTAVVPMILHEMKKKSADKMQTWKQLIQSLEVGMTGIVRKAGYNVASLLYERRGYPVFRDGQCLKNTGPKSRFEMNPTSWCNVKPEEVIFVKWGGEPMRTPGFMCNSSLANMENMMETFAEEHPEWQLTIPEALMGGAYYDLFREYNAEAWRDRNKNKLANLPPILPDPQATAKICFVVRTHSLHTGPIQENSHSHLMNKDVALLLASLQRQTNPNWLAFFFLIDHNALETGVGQLLHLAQDPRVFYVPTNAMQRPPYTVEDGGSTVTDYVLQSVVLPRKECLYISITSGDNAYGSEVVDRVFNAGLHTGNPTFSRQQHGQRRRWATNSSPSENSDSNYQMTFTHHISGASWDKRSDGDGNGDVKREEDKARSGGRMLRTKSMVQGMLDMLIAPLDSRRFAQQDHEFRTRLRAPEERLGWQDFCVGIDAMLEFNLLAYAVRPIPAAGRVDSAAVFLRREALLRENLLLRNFTSPEQYPCVYNVTDPPAYKCMGSAAAYLTEHLARRRRWSYLRLPLDGMKSLVFHGNSPTLCIGSGNVWLDMPRPEDRTCLTHKEILRIGANVKVNSRYDFDHFDAHGEILGTCLRLREGPFREGYSKRDWLKGFPE